VGPAVRAGPSGKRPTGSEGQVGWLGASGPVLRSPSKTATPPGPFTLPDKHGPPQRALLSPCLHKKHPAIPSCTWPSPVIPGMPPARAADGSTCHPPSSSSSSATCEAGAGGLCLGGSKGMAMGTPHPSKTVPNSLQLVARGRKPDPRERGHWRQTTARQPIARARASGVGVRRALAGPHLERHVRCIDKLAEAAQTALCGASGVRHLEREPAGGADWHDRDLRVVVPVIAAARAARARRVVAGGGDALQCRVGVGRPGVGALEPQRVAQLLQLLLRRRGGRRTWAARRGREQLALRGVAQVGPP
jgi:hypothetical protein